MRRSCRWLTFVLGGLLLASCTRPTAKPRLPKPRPAPRTPPLVGLNVGNLAPEIDGEDLDGVRFKLSDFRGKVVLLDFWGHW